MLRFGTNGSLMNDEAGASGGGGDVESLMRRVEGLGNAIRAEREKAQKVQAAAVEKERQGMILHEIARRGIKGDVADDALRYFRDELTLTEDGKLAGRDGFTSAEDIFQRTLAVKKHWLPAHKGGTAATPQQAFDMDEIKIGMSPEKKAEALSAINRALGRS